MEMDRGGKIRTVLQLLVYINQLLVVLGKSPLGDTQIYLWITFGLTVGITSLTYWKNNDWTHFAKVSTQVYNVLKDGRLTEDELKEFVENHKKN